MGIIKAGKVVVLLAGRYAGRKAVVVKPYDEGTGDRKFSLALVAGIDRYPRKVTRAMSKAKVTKRSKVKPFIKYVNVNHMMPTRYQVDMDLKKILDEAQYKADRVACKKAVKKVFEDRYVNQAPGKASEKSKKATGTKYFFEKLPF